MSIIQLDSAVVQLFYIETRSLLLVLSKEIFLHQLILVSDCEVEEKIRVCFFFHFLLK